MRTQHHTYFEQFPARALHIERTLHNHSALGICHGTAHRPTAPTRGRGGRGSGRHNVRLPIPQRHRRHSIDGLTACAAACKHAGRTRGGGGGIDRVDGWGDAADQSHGQPTVQHYHTRTQHRMISGCGGISYDNTSTRQQVTKAHHTTPHHTTHHTAQRES
jgi:hypothetical protein